MTKGAAQPKMTKDTQQPRMNRACIRATVQRRARGGRRGAPGRLPAFHQDGADRHNEGAAAGGQDDKVVDHGSFRFTEPGGRRDAAARQPFCPFSP